MFFLVFPDDGIDFQNRLIVRVVKDQDFHFFLSVRFRHTRADLHQPSNDISLVVNRQVDGNGGLKCGMLGQSRGLISPGRVQQKIMIKSIQKEKQRKDQRNGGK